jgi:hypothetical protein
LEQAHSQASGFFHNFFIEKKPVMMLSSKGMIPKCSIEKYYRIDRREVWYLKFVLEGYPGLAMMRTLDAQQGLVALHVGPGCENDVDRIVDALQKELQIEEVQSTQGET